MTKNDLNKKRIIRRKQTAEDFTPQALVDEMLDKLPPSVFVDPIKTFCDPAAGNGNFLVAVLQRKLDAGHPPLQALATVFGVELMADNVEEMRDRLLIELPHLSPAGAKAARSIVNHNIVCHDALTWDFEAWRPNKETRKAKALFD
jgi:hypothetical protein